MLPSIVKSPPLTSSLFIGLVVPIPTLPLLFIRNLSVLPVLNNISLPVNALIVIPPRLLNKGVIIEVVPVIFAPVKPAEPVDILLLLVVIVPKTFIFEVMILQVNKELVFIIPFTSNV